MTLTLTNNSVEYPLRWVCLMFSHDSIQICVLGISTVDVMFCPKNCIISGGTGYPHVSLMSVLTWLTHQHFYLPLQCQHEKDKYNLGIVMKIL